MNAYLSKPVDFAALLTLINGFVPHDANTL